MAEKRRCIVCGQIYEWCNHCGDAKPEETWRTIYHDEKCMNIMNIWRAYKGKEITKEAAKASMNQCKPNINLVLSNDNNIANGIKEIFKTNSNNNRDDKSKSKDNRVRRIKPSDVVTEDKEATNDKE